MEIRPSRQIAVILVLSHAAALLPLSYLPWWLDIPLALVVLANLIRSWRRDAWRRLPGSVVRVIHDDEDHFLLGTVGDGEQGGRLLKGGYVSPRLAVLRFSMDDGRVRNLLLMPDAVDSDDFRRFRIQVKRLYA